MHMKMANCLTLVLLLSLFCGSVFGTRPKLFSVKSGTATLAPSPTDGICKSMIETQEYVCEEHTVFAFVNYCSVF